MELWENMLFVKQTEEDINEEPTARFLRYVQKTDGCWLWTGKTAWDGYGYYKGTPSHRFAWMLYNGPIPNNLHVLHRCDIRNCVNPAHLFLGTPKDNAIDMTRKGRNKSRKLTEKEVTEIRNLQHTGVTQISVSKRYNVSPSTIGEIWRRTQWQNV